MNLQMNIFLHRKVYMKVHIEVQLKALPNGARCPDEGSSNIRKSAKVVTMSLEAPVLRQLVTAWGCGADPPL